MKSNLRVPPFVWLILCGLLLSRLATSMSIPFMAIYLHKNVGLSYTAAGFIVGVSFVSYIFGGGLGGWLADRFGSRVVMSFALSSFAVVLFMFGGASSVFTSSQSLQICFGLLSFAGGLSRIWSETMAQLILAGLADESNKVSIFSLRYAILNIGNALGPVLGTWIGVSGDPTSFYWAGSIFLFYFAVFAFSSRHQKLSFKKQETSPSISEVFKVVARDKSLAFFLLGGICSYMAFEQIDSTLSLILLEKFKSTNLFAWLMFANGLTVVSLQLPISRWVIEKVPLLTSLIGGNILIALGIFGLGVSNQHEELYFASMIIFSIGEILTFSIFPLFFDRIAQDHMRGVYFGMMGLLSIGKMLGPWLGGFLLERTGAEITMSSFAAIAFVSMIFYWRSLAEPFAETSIDTPRLTGS